MKAHHIGLISGIYFICLFIHLAFYYSSGEGDSSQTVMIQPGLSNTAIAREIQNYKLIPSSALFVLYLSLSDQNQLIAGSYLIGENETIAQIVNKLVEGRFFRVKVTFPEGSTSEQMSALLEKMGICSGESYRNIVQRPELFERSWLKGVTSLEGYLFPDTYYFPLKVDSRQIVETQLRRFEELYPGDLHAENPQKIHEGVILASIVEREAKEKTEKPLVASVFFNRLKSNMKLESCATVIYAWNHEKGIQIKSLSLDDLKIQSPYNTYIHPGLPPAPISNPGLDSLQAVIQPTQSDYLYFVLAENGFHYFSKTYDEHLKNKKKNTTP